jgi:hypothetical protein
MFFMRALGHSPIKGISKFPVTILGFPYRAHPNLACLLLIFSFNFEFRNLILWRAEHGNAIEVINLEWDNFPCIGEYFRYVVQANHRGH